MLASPSGPVNLDKVEAMTRNGHGLYTLPVPAGGFADLHVGVLANGFLPEWMKFLGHDTSDYPTKKPKSVDDLKKVPTGMVCSLRDLFASMPEIDDLFAEVFGGPPGWISVAYDQKANAMRTARIATPRRVDSTYGLFLDPSGEISIDSLQSAGWPLAEIRQAEDYEGKGTAFRARVDHAGHDLWWTVLPTHSSPFGNRSALLFPTVGGLRDYRTIAAATLYALSIMARYLPSAWRRIQGGRRRSVSRSGAALTGGLGTSPSGAFPRKHRGGNRTHCATRELAGVSAIPSRQGKPERSRGSLAMLFGARIPQPVRFR